MKKRYSCILAVLICVMMLLTATACGTRVEEESVWVGGDASEFTVKHSSGSKDNGTDLSNQSNNSSTGSDKTSSKSVVKKSSGNKTVNKEGRTTDATLADIGSGKGADLKGADVVIASWGSGDGTPSASDPTYADQVKLVKDIEKKYNCKIKYKKVADSMAYLGAWTTAAQAGTKFADILTAGTSWLYPLHMKNGYLTPLDNYLDLNSAVFNKKGNDQLVVNGKHYVTIISNRIKIPGGLIFNRAVFKKLGITDTPDTYVKSNNWNFNTFLNLAKRLTKSEAGVQYYGFASTAPGGWAVANGGQSVIKSNGKYIFNMGSSQYINGLQFAYDLTNTYHVVGGSFNNGTAAMGFGDNYRGQTYMDAIGSSNYGFTYVPHGPDVKDYQLSMGETTCFGIPSTCKNPQVISGILFDYTYPYKWRTTYEKQNESLFGDATSLKTALEMGRKANANLQLSPLYQYITRDIGWHDYGISKKISPQAYIKSVSKTAQDELDTIWEQ